MIFLVLGFIIDFQLKPRPLKYKSLKVSQVFGFNMPPLTLLCQGKRDATKFITRWGWKLLPNSVSMDTLGEGVPFTVGQRYKFRLSTCPPLILFRLEGAGLSYYHSICCLYWHSRVVVKAQTLQQASSDTTLVWRKSAPYCQMVSLMTPGCGRELITRHRWKSWSEWRS